MFTDNNGLPVFLNVDFAIDKGKYSVFTDALITVAMIASELERDNQIEYDGSFEANAAIREIAEEFVREHYSDEIKDKGVHWALLRHNAEEKLVDRLAEKHSYRVSFSCTKDCHVYVEAKSEEDAERIAKAKIREEGNEAVEFDDDDEADVEPESCFDVYCID